MDGVVFRFHYEEEKILKLKGVIYDRWVCLFGNTPLKYSFYTDCIALDTLVTQSISQTI